MAFLLSPKLVQNLTFKLVQNLTLKKDLFSKIAVQNLSETTIKNSVSREMHLMKRAKREEYTNFWHLWRPSVLNKRSFAATLNFETTFLKTTRRRRN